MAGHRKAFQVHQIGVRLGPEALAWLQQRADAERMATSTLVRTLIEREVRRDLLKGKVQDDLLRASSDE
jgi:hypothetical protein